MVGIARCPFCGSDGKVNFNRGYYTIMCKNDRCKVLTNTLPFKSQEQAVKAWNTRFERYKGR